MDMEIPVTARKWNKKMQERTAAITGVEEAEAVPAHALAPVLVRAAEEQVAPAKPPLREKAPVCSKEKSSFQKTKKQQITAKKLR